MKECKTLNRQLDAAIRSLLLSALKSNIKHPGFVIFVLKTIFRQRRAAGLRRSWLKEGINVPAFSIFSITGRCNLKCKGCYSHAQGRSGCSEANTGAVEKIIREAAELGICIMLIAGGEPFLRKDVIDILARFPQMLFPVFTNGLLLNEADMALLKKARNIVPVVSMEGMADETDDRRGKGVFQELTRRIAMFNKSNIFYGISLTVTTGNMHTLTAADFVSRFYDEGCRLFFYNEYVPAEAGTDTLALSIDDRNTFMAAIKEIREKYDAVFIAFPGDEAEYGGCLAAGRGFVHINPQGGLEPCPFAPYSDANIISSSFKDALKSELLERIREEHSTLSEGTGGCALWENRNRVEELLEQK